MATAFLTGVALPGRNSTSQPTTCTRRATSLSMNAGAPPESQVAPYYPLQCRFEAPYLSLWDVPKIELMNKIGVVMEEVPLDMKAGAAILAEYRPGYVKESGDFSNLFSSDIEDTSAESPADRYFPATRRYEVPVIGITGNTEEQGSVTLAVGKIVPGEVDDGPAAATEAADVAAREGPFWKRSVKPGAEDAVLRNFGEIDRNKAPVIDLSSGDLAVSVVMQEITGQPAADMYANRYMQAPLIRIKAPAGEWDNSAFIEVSSEEVQLPILSTVSRD